MSTNDLRFTLQRQVELLPELAHPADLTCVHVDHQDMGGTSLFTTAPAPIKVNSPMATPQTMVQLTPSVAPFLHQGIAVFVLAPDQ